MEEYLSEKEQLERFTGWLRDNIPWIVSAAALGVLIVGGYRWWQARADRLSLDASARYQQVLGAFGRNDRAGGLRLVEALDHDHPGSPYTDQANLAAARELVETSDLERAASYLTAVMNDSHDSELALVARLRLARVQVAQDRPEAALATLGSEPRGAFEARFAEVRGDAWHVKGDATAALREYRAARAATGPALSGDDVLDQKIQDLAGEVTAAASPVAVTAASSAPTTGKR